MSSSDNEILYTLGELDLLSKPPDSPRRLPSVPKERPSSRPLPPIPRALACKECMTVITSISLLLPLEAVSLILYCSPISVLICFSDTSRIKSIQGVLWEGISIHRNVRSTESYHNAESHQR